MKIKNLYPCTLEENGETKIYDKHNRITIRNNTFSISSNPNIFYVIESTNKITHTDYLKTKLKEKYVYCLRKADKNNEEIYVSLTWWQNIKFNIMHIKKALCSFFKYTMSFFKWLIEVFFSA